MYRLRYITFFMLAMAMVNHLRAQNLRTFRDISPKLNIEETLAVANGFFNEHNYYNAKNYYLQVLREEEQNEEANYQIARTYAFLRNFDSATVYFEKVQSFNTRSYELLDFYHGRALKACGKIEEAKTAFNNFLKDKKPQSTSEATIAQWELSAMEGNGNFNNEHNGSGESSLSSISSTLTSNSFGAVKGQEDNVYYTGIKTIKSSGKKSVGDIKVIYKKYYVSRIYEAKFEQNGKVQRSELSINLPEKEWSIGSPFLTPDGNKLYYTLCDNNNQHCQVFYSSKKSNNKWSDPVKVEGPVNLEGSETKYPSLGKADNENLYLFFSSNRPGGHGGYDVWFSKLDEEGLPTSAINLGAGINTKEDELTPYFDNQSRLLFFSSNGHKGMGMLDVYLVTLDFEKNMGIIYNAGPEVNSYLDDFYFNLYNQGKSGFVSSNRLGNHTKNQSSLNDNIYDLTFNDPFTFKNLPEYLTEVESFGEEDIAFKLFSESFNYKTLLADNSHEDSLSLDDITINGSIFQNGEAIDKVVYLMDENNRVIDSTNMNDIGKFQFRNLPADNHYSIRFKNKDKLVANMQFYDREGNELLSVNTDENEEYFNYHLLKEQSSQFAKMNDESVDLSGELMLDGEKVSNSRIFLLDENGRIVDSGYTDEEGRFHFKSLPNNTNYVLRIEENESVKANMQFFDEEGNEILSVNSEDDQAYFKYKLIDNESIALNRQEENNIDISGSLIEDGMPLKNKQVFLMDENGNIVATGYTNEKGEFNFKQLPNSDKYVLQLNEEENVQANMHFFDADGNEFRLVNSDDDDAYFQYKELEEQASKLSNIEEESISISGNLLEGGNPAKNKEVLIIDENGNIVGTAYTDDNGEFQFRNLPVDGNYTLRMGNEGDMEANMQFFDQSGKEILNVNSNEDQAYFKYQELSDQSSSPLTLEEENISISGSLFEMGQPAANSHVFLVDESGNIIQEGYTDENGEFHFKNLPNSQNYILRMDKDKDMSADMRFFDADNNLLSSINSNENKGNFEYKNLDTSNANLNSIVQDDPNFNLAENNQDEEQSVMEMGDAASKLKSLFRRAMTYDQYNKIVKDHGETLAKYVNLRVQIGAFRRPKSDLFNDLGLGEIDMEISDGITKFLIGNFNTLGKAEVLRKKAFDQGISDAFVSVYIQGNRVALLIYSEQNKMIRKYVESKN